MGYSTQCNSPGEGMGEERRTKEEEDGEKKQALKCPLVDEWSPCG